MHRFIISRLVQMVVTLFIVSLLVFFMVRLKGDPIAVMAPPTFSQEQIAAMRQAWGFDKPLVEQYVVFLTRAVTGTLDSRYRRAALRWNWWLNGWGIRFYWRSRRRLSDWRLRFRLGWFRRCDATACWT